jgi:hypothetical protein
VSSALGEGISPGALGDSHLRQNGPDGGLRGKVGGASVGSHFSDIGCVETSDRGRLRNGGDLWQTQSTTD